MFRIMFNLVVIAFGAGIALKVWKQYQVNYLHILQLDHKNSIVFIEFWKIAFFYLAIELTILYIFLN